REVEDLLAADAVDDGDPHVVGVEPLVLERVARDGQGRQGQRLHGDRGDLGRDGGLRLAHRAVEGAFDVAAHVGGGDAGAGEGLLHAEVGQRLHDLQLQRVAGGDVDAQAVGGGLDAKLAQRGGVVEVEPEVLEGRRGREAGVRRLVDGPQLGASGGQVVVDAGALAVHGVAGGGRGRGAVGVDG